MALSELDMMNLWAKQLSGYKSQWERLFDFGYAVEAEARRDALEEAAKVFDGEGEEAYSYHAAERIRKLKEDIQ